MSEIKYEFLDRMTIRIHREQQPELAASTLEDIQRFNAFEFYDREKMLTISKAGGIQREINRLVREVLIQREASSEGSNTECIAMDRLTEFLSKLDLEDFRKVPIEGLLSDQAEHTSA